MTSVVRFPFNTVPYVEVPLQTLLRDASVVQGYIERGELTPVRELLMDYGLPSDLYQRALEQLAVGISLHRPLDEQELIKIRVFLHAFHNYLPHADEVREPEPLRTAVATPQTSLPSPPLQKQLPELAERFTELNQSFDRLYRQPGARVVTKQTLQALRDFRLSYAEDRLLMDEQIRERDFLTKLREESLSKFRRNLIPAFMPPSYYCLTEVDGDHLMALAFYLMCGPSRWLNEILTQVGLEGDDPEAWFPYSDAARSELKWLLSPKGMKRDSPFWAGDCLKFLCTMASDREKQRISGLPLSMRLEMWFYLWWLRR